MTPAKLNLTIYQGATFLPVRFTALDENGAAVNLTGWSVYAVARVSPTKAEAFDFAPVVTTAASGLITIPQMTDEATAVLTPGRYTWDMILENGAGQRLGPYFSGIVDVLKINSRA